MLAAGVTHAALYLLLPGGPVLWILALNYAGEAVTLPWSGVALPMRVHANPAARKRVEDLHESLGRISTG
jgi:cytochrome b561